MNNKLGQSLIRLLANKFVDSAGDRLNREGAKVLKGASERAPAMWATIWYYKWKIAISIILLYSISWIMKVNNADINQLQEMGVIESQSGNLPIINGQPHDPTNMSGNWNNPIYMLDDQMQNWRLEVTQEPNGAKFQYLYWSESDQVFLKAHEVLFTNGEIYRSNAGVGFKFSSDNSGWSFTPDQ